jgi:uncharacterized membrane protein (Fun14 family)
LARWQKLLVGVAVAFVLIGGGLKLGAAGPEETEEAPSTVAVQRTQSPPASGEGLATRAVPGGQPTIVTVDGTPLETVQEPPAASEAGSDWSPFFFKGGFGFFVGFCVGFALRAFFRVSAVALGFLFLLLLGLSYAGVLEVNWETLEQLYDRGVARMRDELQQVHSFVIGSIPSTAFSSLGLVAGFKRR